MPGRQLARSRQGSPLQPPLPPLLLAPPQLLPPPPAQQQPQPQQLRRAGSAPGRAAAPPLALWQLMMWGPLRRCAAAGRHAAGAV